MAPEFKTHYRHPDGIRPFCRNIPGTTTLNRSDVDCAFCQRKLKQLDQLLHNAAWSKARERLIERHPVEFQELCCEEELRLGLQ